MNSKQIQSLEPNQQHIVTSYTTSTNIIQNIQNENQPFLTMNNPQINETLHETKKIIKNENGSKTIQEIQEKEYKINSVPFKSLLQNEENSNFQELPQFSSKYINKQNNLFNNISYNPFTPNLNINQNSKREKEKVIQNEIKQQKIYNTNKIERYFDKKLKSHNIRNSINEKQIFDNNVFRIQTFKSHGKQEGRLTTFENILNTKNILELTKINEDNEKYLLLIKRIAMQLKRKVKPPTQGFFYKIIRNEQYLLLIKRIAIQLKRKVKPPTQGFFYQRIISNKQYLLLIKRIAFQLKRKTRAPTHGFFYKYIRNEQYRLLIKRIAFQLKIRKRSPTHGYFFKYIRNEQYRLLIKRIAFQLKRRIRLPTCKIIKIYESYIKLIRRIARQLNISRKQRMANKNINTSFIIEEKIYNNGSDRNMILSNNQVNNINNLNYETNIFNNNQVNQNIQSINSFNEIKKVTSESSIPSYNINSKVEKIEIEEEIPEINNNHNILNIQNIENNNINNDFPLNKEDNQNEFSAQNSVKVNLSGNNFSFHDSDKNLQQEGIQEKKIVEEKIEINNKINNQNINYKDSNLFSSNESIKNKKEDIYIQSYPSLSKNKKSVNINLSIFKKEGSNDKENQLKLSEEKNVQNRSYKKETNILNRLNNDININEDKDSDLNVSQDLNVSLSNIEVSKTNFINDFNKFLNKVNIQIINNFPVSLNEKNKHYFQQSNFWLLIMNYLFFQNNNISLYTIISLLEQYFLWCTDINLDNFSSIKERIKEYIESNFSSESISQFLFMNHLKSIDEIFEKYEICIKNKATNYKEIKINNINLPNNEKIKCNCELCTNDNACIKKVIDINKSKINVINDINMDILGKNEMLPEYEQKLNNISNKEEIFYKGKSKSNKYLFSKSKTVYTGNTNLEYKIMNQNISKNENTEEIFETENDNEKNKTYKNISKKKSRKKEKEINYEEEDINKEEKIENEEKEEKEEKEEEEKEEKDDGAIDNKNKKKTKKNKKGKSRSRNKKKRESSKSDKEDNENDEKEEVNKEEKEEEIKTERSKQKKKKKDKKINKNIEKEEKSDSEENIGKEEEKNEEEIEVINTNISKRKKSKTPNKKSRKH